MSQQADAFMGIFGMKRSTCYSCRSSIGRATPTGSELWCELRGAKAIKACESYSYECGSDEHERKQDE